MPLHSVLKSFYFLILRSTVLLNAEILRSKEKQEENNERCPNKEYFIRALINVKEVVWLLIHRVPLPNFCNSSLFAG